MPGFMLHVNASINCTHGAPATIISSNVRVKVGGMPVATLNDQTQVAGCPFQIPFGVGTKPQPCVSVRWITPALRVKVNNQPVLLSTSNGICQSVEQIPQGPPAVTATQVRVKAT